MGVAPNPATTGVPSRSSPGRWEAAACQGFCGVEQPSQGVECFRGAELVLEITSGVDHRTLQHVQVVVQRVEFAARHHQFALAERQLACPLARHPVPLATTLRTEGSWTPRARPGREDDAAPSTAPLFRHRRFMP